MTAARRNEVIALAPSTIRTLAIPLTPAQAARVDVFEIRTGVKVEEIIADLLDDLVFALPERRGASS